MLYAKIIIVLTLAIAIDSMVPRFWAPFSYIDLPLLVTVYFALMRDPMLAMLIGTAAGLGGDLTPGAGPIHGVGGFSKTLIGFIIATIGVRVPLEGSLIRVLVLAISSIVNSALFLGLHNLMDQRLTDEASPETLAIKVAFEATGNLVFGVFTFWVLDKLFPEQASARAMQVRRRFYD